MNNELQNITTNFNINLDIDWPDCDVVYKFQYILCYIITNSNNSNLVHNTYISMLINKRNAYFSNALYT